MKQLVISKKISWSIRILIIISVCILAYTISIKISKQTELDNLYDAASEQVKSNCTIKTKYNNKISFFKNKKKDEYYTCITESNDPLFKRAAAKYILNMLKQNGETPASRELKKIVS